MGEGQGVEPWGRGGGVGLKGRDATGRRDGGAKGGGGGRGGGGGKSVMGDCDCSRLGVFVPHEPSSSIRS